jgi:hypothetical protein
MPLKGRLFCADCGSLLYRYKSVTGGGKYCDWIYLCRTSETLNTCPHKYLHNESLNNAVYDAIRLEIEKCADINGIIGKLNRESSHKRRLTRFDSEILEAEREIKRIAMLRQAVYDDYAGKVITVSEYQFANDKYNADAEKQKQRLDTAKQEKEQYLQSATPTNKWLAAFTRFMESKELDAGMVQALIERVDVKSPNSVDVTFKFRDEYAAICGFSKYGGVA